MGLIEKKIKFSSYLFANINPLGMFIWLSVKFHKLFIVGDWVSKSPPIGGDPIAIGLEGAFLF
jgi:hypothetical protein